VPINGNSAIDVEQPPSASADSTSAPKISALFSRFSDMRPEVPLYQLTFLPNLNFATR
jgi:hypothetical protein